MSAKRVAGEYSIKLDWEPLRRGDVGAGWTLGTYRWRIYMPHRRHAVEDGWFHVWRDGTYTPDSMPYGAMPETLGVSENDLGKPRGYDAAALAIVEQEHAQWPNRTLYREMLDAGIKRRG